MQEPRPFDDLADRLERSVALFGLLPAMAVGIVLAVLLGPLVGLVGAVVVAAGWAVLVVVRARRALGRTLAVMGARPLRSGERPRWENVVEGLSLTSGVPRPDLHLVDRPGANALALADREHAVLVVTPGLLDVLSVVQMEAVAANLYGRLKDGSARYGTVTVGLFGPFLGRVEAAGRVVAEGLGEQRAVHSDLAAIGITRYPPGLASALSRLEREGTAVDGVDPSTAHLWLAPVLEGGAGVDPAVAETALQPLGTRVAVLEEL